MKQILLLALTVLLWVAIAGCSPANITTAKPPAPVLTAVVAEKTIPVLIDPAPVGHVEPVSSVKIRPQVGGIISAVNFEEGREVKRGDSLFTLDPRPTQAALEQAQANLQRDLAQLENVKIQFGRDEKLFAQSLISQDQYDTSRAAVDGLNGTIAADRAAVTNAELNLQYTDIRSPIDGRTGSLLFHAGNVVKSPDDVLLTINQIHPIYVTFAVPEKYLPEIREEMRTHQLAVTASFENLSGEPPRGKLTFIDNAVDESTGTIELKATFANADGQLWPGQFVRVGVTLNDLTNAVVVPSQALQTGQNGTFVYVVKADKTVEERPVTAGVNHEDWVVVNSGLKPGEVVVTDGQLRLAPGATVEAKAAAATPAP